jgi:hypothetical protein
MGVVKGAYYGDKLAAYRDKDAQKAAITAEQQQLQDEIAADMQLQPGEQRNVTYQNVGYVVKAIPRYLDTGDILSCTINYSDIHEEIV